MRQSKCQKVEVGGEETCTSGTRYRVMDVALARHTGPEARQRNSPNPESPTLCHSLMGQKNWLCR